MELLTHWLGKSVELELSGCKLPIQGEIIDVGQDLIVVYGNQRFVYIPLHHVQSMHVNTADDSSIVFPTPDPEMDHTNISYRKMLMNARGRFSEISIGGKTLHGYITNIMNDYFMFYSPLYHSIYVSINHLKYIIPSPTNSTPYSLSKQHFPMQPSSMSLSRTLDQQLHKMIGELVVLNLGCKPYRAGLLKNADNHLLALVEADGTSLIMHTDHIQTIHLP